MNGLTRSNDVCLSQPEFVPPARQPLFLLPRPLKMLTPKGLPGDFLVGTRPNAAKKRLCRSGLHPASSKEPGFSRGTESYL
jgi:hypothetical protein